MKDSHLFKLARECSMNSDYSGTARVGCVVVYKGTVIAKGFNSDKTHPVQDIWNVKRYKNVGNNYLPSKGHAEILALTKIKFLDIDFSKVEVFVYRELRDGSLALARPCPSCMAAIKAMGIRKIHYSTPDGFAKECFK